MPVSHIWSDSTPGYRREPIIRVLAGKPQAVDLLVPFSALYRGTVYAKLFSGADLPQLDAAIACGEVTGIVEVVLPHCYRVYVNGQCRVETTSMHVAAAELTEYVERPGILLRLALWLLGLHDARTADRISAALDVARETPV